MRACVPATVQQAALDQCAEQIRFLGKRTVIDLLEIRLRKPSNARDSALQEFGGHVLRLVQMTRKASQSGSPRPA